MTARPISAVAVVIPARDEEDDIENCLRSVRVAVDALPGDLDTALTVVLDRCTDSTPQRVDAQLRCWPGATSVRVVAVGGRRGPSSTTVAGAPHIVAGSGVGALRDLGVRDALSRLRPHRPESVWVLGTDADSTVPPHWARAHLELAEAGAAAVAGMVELAPWGVQDLDGRAARRAVNHDRLVLAGVEGERHEHVYGANLGVRGDAYLAVGGFPTDGPGEDHGLCSALREAGYPLLTPTGLRVQTSARTVGRAEGGLADLLSSMQDTESPAG